MPAGMSVRIYKKRCKAAITRIADVIPAAFASKADRKRWISLVTNLRMKDMQTGGQNGSGKGTGGTGKRGG